MCVVVGCVYVCIMNDDEEEDLQSWGWTDLSSYSSSSDSEQQQVSSSSDPQQRVSSSSSDPQQRVSSSSSDPQQRVSSSSSDPGQTGVMSRCSLRLDEGLSDRSLPRGSAPVSVGRVSWRSGRSVRSGLSQRHAASCSEALLFLGSPHKGACQSVTSDASLISSLLDESSIQEATQVDAFWGLDQDADSKDDAVVAQESCALIGSDGRCKKHLFQNQNTVYCKDCRGQNETETPVIYSRDRRTRAGRPGLCGTMNLKEAPPVGSLCGSAAEAFRWIYRRWSPTTTSSHLSRFLLRLFMVLLLLLLLLLSLCWFGPAGFCSVFPGLNVTTVDPVQSLSSMHSFLSPHSQSAEPDGEEPSEEEPSEEELLSRPPAVETPAPQVGSQEVHLDPEPMPAVDSERLVQVEQSLMVLRGRVESAGRWAERRHREVLQLYADLHRRPSLPQSGGGEGVEPWIRDLMDRQLFLLQIQLDEERQKREQMRQQDLLLLKAQTTRLDHLELHLQSLAARTQEVQWTPEPSATSLPAAVGAGVDGPSHDALQAEVLRLEAALGDVRRDIQGLSECRNGLERIQQISERVSVLVQEEVRALMYGNQLAARGDSAPLPESVLRWLSERFVTEASLQEALSALEHSILQNVSRKLRRGEETGREDVLDSTGNAVTPEDVHAMVTDALRLFAQDRIGLADYALESGGGSVLSTRCSETFETKAALLSLFGVPLWYFSQSPRAVIQPDVHPGNCWAFKGSKGFLVIKLSMRILPTAVTLEHIPKVLAPSGMLRSAPRDFRVYGLRDESEEEGRLLGQFTYEEDGEDLQTFSLTEENHESFQIIEVQVLSNWGHPDYTCMYRFRVHGTPDDV
ncbi:SUN domain-containing protein 1 isoform X2 [Austrofundulus limnaeus]|uniref:SUN domain-containing protein 1 isoform X2 n=1 Tax=Austrofundulus limnaeus TaxID=52670 RepID=A0A2I4CFN7_AUSLI|nr:PREDICTED: SUN domain-containing protein 1-like isoform X2 [Austrofundulus limnaeus]